MGRREYRRVGMVAGVRGMRTMHGRGRRASGVIGCWLVFAPVAALAQQVDRRPAPAPRVVPGLVLESSRGGPADVGPRLESLGDGRLRHRGKGFTAIVDADGSLVCDGAAGTSIAASGWTAPLAHNVGSGFRTPDRPTHHGVDIIAPRGAEIHAAASGRVLVAQCDPDQYGRYTCDVDGSPQKMGCGWFVDILHAQNYVTRYCHLVERPYVRVGQKVRAGQIIGKVGTSGNSSGPHLHFEVHINGDRSSAGAIDPVPFMRAKGAPLTQDS